MPERVRGLRREMLRQVYTRPVKLTLRNGRLFFDRPGRRLAWEMREREARD